MQAQTQNSTRRFDRGALEAQLDAIKDEVSHLLDRVTGRSEHTSRLGAITARTTDVIKAHPIAATAAALAIGYLAVRIIRR